MERDLLVKDNSLKNSKGLIRRGQDLSKMSKFEEVKEEDEFWEDKFKVWVSLFVLKLYFQK